jgi:hypothetical protein
MSATLIACGSAGSAEEAAQAVRVLASDQDGRSFVRAMASGANATDYGLAQGAVPGAVAAWRHRDSIQSVASLIDAYITIENAKNTYDWTCAGDDLLSKYQAASELDLSPLRDDELTDLSRHLLPADDRSAEALGGINRGELATIVRALCEPKNGG